MAEAALKIQKQKTPPKRLIKQIQKLQKAGQYTASLSPCLKLIENGYKTAPLLNLLALAQRGAGDLNTAVVSAHAAVQQEPENCEYLVTLATLFYDLGDNETAIELFKNATKLDKNSYEAWLRLGIALRMAERYEAAEIAFTFARHIDPTQINPVLNMVVMLHKTNAYDKAEIILDDLLKNPKNHTPLVLLRRLHVAARKQDLAYIEKQYPLIDRTKLSVDDQAELDNIWAFYLDLHFRHDEAIEILEKWAYRDTSHRDLITSFLGIVYAISGRIDEGVALQHKTLQEDPNNVAARYNLSDLQLRKGQVSESYKNYEARWEWWGFPSTRRKFHTPRWQGENLTGKKLLVWREQGVGDEITYASLLPDLEHSGADVVFECTPKLKAIWERSFPWLTLHDEGPEDCRGEPAYDSYDYQIPIGSLPLHFRPDIESFVEKQTQWVKRDLIGESIVRKQLGVKDDDLLVGICLRSGHQSESRNPSFVTPAQAQALNGLKNIKWLNLQYDNTVEEIEELRSLGIDLHHYTDVDQKQDMDTASACIGACDIVISAGVSVADIACGMGVPTVHIAREHSAIHMGTDFIPWFPTARAYQMPPNGGEGLIGRIVNDWDEILSWAGTKTNSGRPIETSNKATTTEHPVQNQERSKLNLLFHGITEPSN